MISCEQYEIPKHMDANTLTFTHGTFENDRIHCLLRLPHTFNFSQALR